MEGLKIILFFLLIPIENKTTLKTSQSHKYVTIVNFFFSPCRTPSKLSLGFLVHSR